MTPELRQMRYVVAVAEARSFTRAAARMHIAQQALSQQVRAVEDQIGVELFARTSRGVVVTAPGAVFVQEAKRVINAAERAVARTHAASRGEAGVVRLVYTLTTVYETFPAIVERLAESCPGLRVQDREVFGADVEPLLLDGGQDLAFCPRTALPAELRRQEVRREPFVAALASGHRLAERASITVSDLAGDLLEVWPREMAPGFYDAVLGACRDAGFEPRVDEHASGSTVWGNIAAGRGGGLVVRSLALQQPRGIVLVPIESPPPQLTIDAVWHAGHEIPAVERVLEAAAEVGAERNWLPT